MLTLSELENLAGTRVLDHLDREASLPVVGDINPQGDVIIVRNADLAPATTLLPVSGAAVVRGEAGGNTHSLHADKDSGVCWDVVTKDGDSAALALGTLTVPAGACAYLLHPEHGGMAVEEGTYYIGRQREYAGEWALVAD